MSTMPASWLAYHSARALIESECCHRRHGCVWDGRWMGYGPFRKPDGTIFYDPRATEGIRFAPAKGDPERCRILDLKEPKRCSWFERTMLAIAPPDVLKDYCRIFTGMGENSDLYRAAAGHAPVRGCPGLGEPCGKPLSKKRRLCDSCLKANHRTADARKKRRRRGLGDSPVPLLSSGEAPETAISPASLGCPETEWSQGSHDPENAR